jgi:drug/metabolite transporter (DMT)-like permease
MTRSMRAGAIAAVGAAASFGVTVPLVQRFGHDVGAWSTAALLYTGAAIVAGGFGGEDRRPLRPHALRIVIIAILGAAAAPALLAMGLRLIDGASASLLLGFEAAFTVLFARILYREPITRRLAIALLVMFLGGVVLVRPTLAAARGGMGALLVLIAVLCWAGDSAIMRPLSDYPAARVVRAKSLVGIAASLVAAFVSREKLPPTHAALALIACGALGYGVSLRLYLRAQRNVGAARTASVFSAAPFFGAVVALAMGERGDLRSIGIAALLLAIGVVLQATEQYDHAPTSRASGSPSDAATRSRTARD